MEAITEKRGVSIAQSATA